MDEQLRTFRIRWNRWLGQKTRRDRDSWVDLTNTNWTGWAEKVYDAHGIDHSDCEWSIDGVWIFFYDAIQVATMKELFQLDSLYVQSKL